jgi:hypothetical protein
VRTRRHCPATLKGADPPALIRKYTNASTGKPEVLVVSGNWKGRDAEIRLGSKDGPVVAAITREHGISRTLIGTQTFVMNIAPGGSQFSSSARSADAHGWERR